MSLNLTDKEVFIISFIEQTNGDLWKHEDPFDYSQGMKTFTEEEARELAAEVYEAFLHGQNKTNLKPVLYLTQKMQKSYKKFIDLNNYVKDTKRLTKYELKEHLEKLEKELNGAFGWNTESGTEQNN